MNGFAPVVLSLRSVDRCVALASCSSLQAETKTGNFEPTRRKEWLLKAVVAAPAKGDNFDMITRCAQCNAPMSCSPQGDCWCADCPPVAASPDATRCLCPECLREKLRQSQKEESSRTKSAS